MSGMFFIELRDVIEQTNIRRISLQEAKEFAELHRITYTQLVYNCISIPNNSVKTRVEEIMSNILGLLKLSRKKNKCLDFSFTLPIMRWEFYSRIITLEKLLWS